MDDHLTANPTNYDPKNNTKLSYDRKLIPAADALARYKRDEQLREKYEAAEANLDPEQMTWEDVEETLNQSVTPGATDEEVRKAVEHAEEDFKYR